MPFRKSLTVLQYTILFSSISNANYPNKLSVKYTLILHIKYFICLSTAHKRSCGKVIFSLVSVILSGGGRRVGTLHASWDRSHDRVPPSTSDLETCPLPPSPPPDIKAGDLPHPLLLISDCNHWKFVQTCSLEDLASHQWY